MKRRNEGKPLSMALKPLFLFLAETASRISLGGGLIKNVIVKIWYTIIYRRLLSNLMEDRKLAEGYLTEI